MLYLVLLSHHYGAPHTHELSVEAGGRDCILDAQGSEEFVCKGVVTFREF